MATHSDGAARAAGPRKRSVSRPHRDPLKPAIRIKRANHGGSIRTFSGNMPHENGWYPSAKARRLLHWEGMAQLEFVIRSEVDFNVVRLGTESVAFEFPFEGELVTYTADVELEAPDGSLTIVELKRSPKDLSDERYARKLAEVAQICRSNGLRFEVIYKPDIWQSRTHRRNAELCASRRFCSVGIDHLIKLQAHAEATQGHTTLGALAQHLEPMSRATGEALVLALAAARRVRLDLTRPLLDATTVAIV